MNEIETIQENTIVDSRKETENAMYNIRYQYLVMNGEKSLLAVNVSIAERVVEEGGNSYTGIGDIVFNNGQVSMSGFPYSAKTNTYMEEFTAIVEEIKRLLQAEV